jgi:hypothetical protein
MARRDLDLTIVHLLDPAAIDDTDTVSSILDTAGFQASAISVVLGAMVGAAAGVTMLPIFQESNTVVGTDFTTVAAGNLTGAFTIVNAETKDQCTQTVRYHGNKRYIRVNLDFTGSNLDAAVIGVIGILAYPKIAAHAAVAALAAT